MKEQHEWLGLVTSGDIVELYSIGSDIFMITQRLVQQTLWGD